MKRACFLGLVSMVAVVCFGQPAKSTFTASTTGIDRVAMAKNSIDVPTWHEKSFWPVYEAYVGKAEKVSSDVYRALDDLARMDLDASETEAYDHAKKLLNLRNEELGLMRQYYGEIGNAMNGIVSLQFLQMEALIDMMECARIYDGSVYRKYRFQPNAISESEFTTAKYNIIAKALQLPSDKAQAFYEVYTRYDQEADDLLGEEYSMFGFYACEPSDFTPGLSKRLGNDMLYVMLREQKLKEKYFTEMNDAVGSQLAARFLAWEDYYSLICKMHAWADGFNE